MAGAFESVLVAGASCRNGVADSNGDNAISGLAGAAFAGAGGGGGRGLGNMIGIVCSAATGGGGGAGSGNGGALGAGADCGCAAGCGGVGGGAGGCAVCAARGGGLALGLSISTRHSTGELARDSSCVLCGGSNTTSSSAPRCSSSEMITATSSQCRACDNRAHGVRRESVSLASGRVGRRGVMWWCRSMTRAKWLWPLCGQVPRCFKRLLWGRARGWARCHVEVRRLQLASVPRHHAA